MRNIIAATVILAGAGLHGVYSQTVAGVAAKAAQVYDHIVTFSADAYVYEYYG
jgi:hypothetical protein